MMDKDSALFLLETQHIQAGTASQKLFETQTEPVTFLSLYETEYVRLATIATLSGIAGMFLAIVLLKICSMVRNMYVFLRYF